MIYIPKDYIIKKMNLYTGCPQENTGNKGKNTIIQDI